MKDRPLWSMLVLAVLIGCCLGAALFWGWFNFSSRNDVSITTEPTIVVVDNGFDDDGQQQEIERATSLPEPTIVVDVQITSTPLVVVTDVPLATLSVVPTETAAPTAIPTINSSPPTIIPPTQVPQADASAAANGSPTTQTVSFAEPEFAEFISQQATALGLELTDTQAEFASGQGTITGNLSTFGFRMGTELAFTLIAQDGEPQLTVTNGTIGSQPMPQQIIEQIETAFEQGVKSGLQTNGEVYIDSIDMDNGLITVIYSQ